MILIKGNTDTYTLADTSTLASQDKLEESAIVRGRSGQRQSQYLAVPSSRSTLCLPWPWDPANSSSGSTACSQAAACSSSPASTFWGCRQWHSGLAAQCHNCSQDLSTPWRESVAQRCSHQVRDQYLPLGWSTGYLSILKLIESFLVDYHDLVSLFLNSSSSIWPLSLFTATWYTQT